jgi:DNA mismatch endonuclease Vsr
MPDIFTPEKRTSIMSSVKNKNTLPELIVQSLLRDIGIGYEREKKLLNCRPDSIIELFGNLSFLTSPISDTKKVMFIHGCFWHGHDCKRGRLPETNRLFWENKISGNRERDLKNYDELKAAGGDYLVIWGCEIKRRKVNELIEKINSFLLKGALYAEKN